MNVETVGDGSSDGSGTTRTEVIFRPWNQVAINGNL